MLKVLLQGLSIYFIAFIAAFMFGLFKKVNNQKETKGVIIDLKQKRRNQSGRTTYTGVVSFTVNNYDYVIETDYQSSSFRKGKKVTVCYDDNNPNNCFVKTSLIVRLYVYLLILIGTYVIIKKLIIFILPFL